MFFFSDLAVDFASSVIPRSHILNAPFTSGIQRQLSRYFNEFEELQLLGKGAFGAVIKVFSFDPSETMSLPCIVCVRHLSSLSDLGSEQS